MKKDILIPEAKMPKQVNAKVDTDLWDKCEKLRKAVKPKKHTWVEILEFGMRMYLEKYGK